MSDSEPPAGLIAGKYGLTRLLGRGGMGTVWEGVHETLGTRVAVKFIDSEHATSDEVRKRFVNEARAAARLRSKHVVQVYDQGVADDGRPYIVMEFLGGEPLDQKLDREERLSPAETAKIALHVCRALAKAHESGIVHRDLKPENVFLVHDEEDDTVVAKVVDFGIAKFTQADPTASSSTRTGAVLGTPQYMSPEQARGLRTVDARTDLWSLGVIVYRAITGVLPFKGEAVGDLLVNICTGDAPPPSSIATVPAGFDDWVKRALAREPALRFQTAAELCDSLASVCGVDARLGGAASSLRDAPLVVKSTPGAVTASPLATDTVPSVPSRRVPWGALAALFVVVTALVVFFARRAEHASPEPVSNAGVPAAAASVLPGSAAPSPSAPEVTPASAASPPAVAAAEPSAVPAPHAGKPVRTRPAPSTPNDARKSAPTQSGTPHARPADLLGY